jgi:ribonucleoside-diphosphate reductase alpha chain
MKKRPAKFFYSYSHKDEKLRDRLATFLKVLERQRIIETWHDRKILPGSNWLNEINEKLTTSDIVLLLLSSDFLASDYCYDVEMNKALELHEKKKLIVVPVILRSCPWKNSPFAKLQGLPTDMVPAMHKDWHNVDEAFMNITDGLKKLIENFEKFHSTHFEDIDSESSKTKAVQTIVDTQNVEVEITLDEDYDSFETNEFLSAIGKLINLKTDIQIRRKSRGSVKLVIELRKDQALYLQELFKDKVLSRYNVSDINIIETKIRKEREKGVYGKSKKGETIFAYREAMKASTQYFGGDELAASVFINKYALKDSVGNLYEKTPDDMHRRIAKEIYRIEKNYPFPLQENEIYQLLKSFKHIIPQGGPMSGIGNEFQISSLSNCFVIGNMADSYSGILRIDEELVNLLKRRGGVGLDLSHLRPKGVPVLNSALTSTGIVPFMERYSNSTREVAQDGRRGALMITVSSKHPDVEEFIDAKLDLGKITGANISVKIDDSFMYSVLNQKPYTQQFPVNSSNPKLTKEIDARSIWNKLVYNAWKSAEPGILFWDTLIRESISDCYGDLGFTTISTNPCGEIPLSTYDSCKLLTINLFGYVENPYTSKSRFNFELFEEHARLSVRLMDDIIDLEIEKIDRIIEKINSDPEDQEITKTERVLWEKIKDKTIQGRRAGIGVTAEGDMLAALGYRYGTDEAIDFSIKVHQTLALNAFRSSAELASERGSFPIFDMEMEKDNPFIKRLFDADPELKKVIEEKGRRNISLLTVAPTGSTSILSQTTSGIEPVFMVSYKRRKKINPNDKTAKTSFIDEIGDHWEEYNVFHHKFITWLEVNGYDVEEVKNMPDAKLNKIIEKSPYYKASANDVDCEQKVKMQGEIQKWVDHSISVTINLPESTTVDSVNNLFLNAWERGCKGITIYREGSRSGVLVNDKKDNEDTTRVFQVHHSPRRPRKLEAKVVRFMNNKEKWIAVVGLMEGRPYEIFAGLAEETFVLPDQIEKAWVIKVKDNKGKTRYDFQFQDKYGYKVTFEGLSRSFNKEYWNYAKLISGVLRHGMPMANVVELISGLNLNDEAINFWKKGVVRALKKFITDGTVAVKETCENCGESNGLVYVEGCLTCNNCGHSNCG